MQNNTEYRLLNHVQSIAAYEKSMFLRIIHAVNLCNDTKKLDKAMTEQDFKIIRNAFETFEILMTTKINDELQIRRLLIEKVERLEKQIIEEKATFNALSETVAQYVARKEGAEQKFKNLLDTVETIAMQMPQRYRRQIINALPK